VTRYAPQWIQAASYGAAQDRRLISALWPGPASSGCNVVATTAMTVQVQAGQVAVPTQNNSGTTLCTSDAAEQVTLTASAAQPRIDLITCHPRGTDLDGGTNNDFIFDFVTGTPAASPTVPATPAGQVALAQIAVGAGVASIVAGNITDVRPGGLAIAATPARYPLGYIAQTVGPAAQTDYTAFTAVIAVTATLTAGRWYRATGYVNGGQVSATGTVVVRVRDPAGGDTFAINESLVSGQGRAATVTRFFQAAATGSAAFTLYASASAGAYRLTANAASLTVEDAGTG
jgi:hypothetical protein